MAKYTYKLNAALLLLAGLFLVSSAHAQSSVSATAINAADDEHYADPVEVQKYRDSQMAALAKVVGGDEVTNLTSMTGGGSLTCSDEGYCVDIELASVETNASGETTYTFQVKNKCHRSLSHILFALPGVFPTSWASDATDYDVELDNSWFIGKFIKFEFDDEIKNGDVVEVSYTLPTGNAHSTAILGIAKTPVRIEGFGLGTESCEPTVSPCVYYSDDQLRAAGTHIVGGDATIVIPNDGCNHEISVSSYELPGGLVRPFEDQILYDNVTDTYGPGTSYVSVDLPDCAWQSDVYLGDVVEHLIPGVGHPTDRIINWDFLEDENLACECVAEPPSFDGQLIKDGSRRLIEINAPNGLTEVEFYNTKNLIIVGTDGLAGFNRVGDTFTWDFGEGAPPTTVRFELEPDDKSNSRVSFFIKITDRCDQVVDIDPEMNLKGAGPVVRDYTLNAAYPNPFNPQTQISFHLPEATNVSLVVYDLTGREVTTLMSGFVADGTHDVTWDGRASTGEQVASGVYLYRLSAGDFSKTMRMTLLK